MSENMNAAFLMAEASEKNEESAQTNFTAAEIAHEAAIINAKVAILNANLAAMTAENNQRILQGESIAYTEKSFIDALEASGLEKYMDDDDSEDEL